MSETREELKEHFANLEHERWSKWHKHSKKNWTPENVARWDRLADTPYSELSEELKQKDRNEVEPYWKQIQSQSEEIARLKEKRLDDAFELLRLKGVIERLREELKGFHDEVSPLEINE